MILDIDSSETVQHCLMLYVKHCVFLLNTKRTFKKCRASNVTTGDNLFLQCNVSFPCVCHKRPYCTVWIY